MNSRDHNSRVFEKRPERFDTVIIGGGPAGLFCAIHAASPVHRTLVVEKMPSCGKKLLITGSGQCNLTHSGEMGEFLRHYGTGGKFLKPAFFAWTNADLCAYFENRGVRLETTEDGKIFPVSRRSRDILDILMQDCREHGAEILCREPVTGITRNGGLFAIDTPELSFEAEYAVLATGGLSYPMTGSTGDGYVFAQSLGQSIVPPAPALTPVSVRDFPFADLAGISFPGMTFSVWRKGRKVIECRGDVLVTHTGLSGPGILDNSRWMSAGDEIRLSFSGGATPDDCERQIMNRIRDPGSRNAASLLTGYQIPGRVLARLLAIAGIHPGKSSAHLTAGERKRLATCLAGLPLIIESLGDFSIAMVTRGGVACSEVNRKNMESRRVKNLFFAGEVLDVDGDTGGYNLQAAFSTGRLAGASIRRRLSPL